MHALILLLFNIFTMQYTIVALRHLRTMYKYNARAIRTLSHIQFRKKKPYRIQGICPSVAIVVIGKLGFRDPVAYPPGVVEGPVSPFLDQGRHLVVGDVRLDREEEADSSSDMRAGLSETYKANVYFSFGM